MAKRTNHTVLARITSHGSGGRAEIASGHWALRKDFADPALTSAYFISHPIRSYVVVRVTLSGKRRLIRSVRQEPGIASYGDFRDIYGEQLKKEAEDYDRRHGLAVSVPSYSEPVAPVTTEPEPVHEEFVPVTPEPVDVSEWVNKIYVDKTDQKVLNTIKALAEKRHVAVMMIGPSGYGKTSIPQQMAADWDMEFLRWDCATVRDPEEFFGFRGARNGSTLTEDGDTIFTPSLFTEVVERGNAVIVLDELNRIDPYISNILFPLLDHAGKTSVAGHKMVVGPNVIFFATVNIGFQFTGTFTLDTALTNRFTAKILVNALPSAIEEKILQARGGVDAYKAHQIVKLMAGLRKLNDKGQLSIDASTRVSIQIAELVGCGLDLKTALLYIVINGVSDEEAKVVIDQYNYVIG